MPVDWETAEDGNIEFKTVEGVLVATVAGPGNGDYTSHFATCPNAGEHRKRGGQREEL